MAPLLQGPDGGTIPSVRAQDAAPQASSSVDKPNARVRRRPRKREGPPQFQFLTATDPSQFKDDNAKRSVRSQAMIQYRYKAEQQKQVDKERKQDTTAPRAVQGAPRPAERITPITSSAPKDAPYPFPHQGYYGSQHPLMAPALDRERDQEQQQRMYDRTVYPWGVDLDEGFAEPAWSPPAAAMAPAKPSRYQRVQSIVPLDATARSVLDFEDCDNHEELQLRLLIAKFASVTHIGDGVDPFAVIPQFASPELDSLFLVRKCNRAFVTQTTMVRWLPVLLSHPHMLLSATLTASTWLDMQAGCSGDSKRTVLVKGETLSWINQRLRNPVQQYEDLTLIAILHLFAGEMWNCNEKSLLTHQSGIAGLIAHRGGMGNLQANVTAEVTAAMIYHNSIFVECAPVPLFNNWEPSRYAPIEEWAALPESPLFCPRTEFFTILRTPRCSETTYELLCDMRDLTDLVIAHHAGLDTVIDMDVEEDSTRVGPSLEDYDAQMTSIRTRLAALPSAYTPGLPTTNDWLYEACRIAAIIYTGAILSHIPFSVSAEPSRNLILSDPVYMKNCLAGGHLYSRPLTEALFEALTKSDTTSIWGDLSGVLYWVASVGAAAARTPATINMSQTPKSRSHAHAIWIRRCLIMHATRPLLLLVFQHPIPIIMAQKNLLKVQKLTGTGNSDRILSTLKT